MSKAEKDSDDTKFTFIKEQIVPKKKSKVKKVIVSLGTTACLAVVFGIIARVAFIVSEPFINDLFGFETNKQEVYFPSDMGEDGTDTASKPQGGDSIGNTSESIEAEQEVNGEKEIEEGEEGKTVNNTFIVEKKISATAKDFIAMMDEVKNIAINANYSLATIKCIKKGVDWLNNPYDMERITTGLIVANNGTDLLILTQLKEVDDADHIKVSFSGSKEHNGLILDQDKETNLAIVTVALKDMKDSVRVKTKIARLGESYSISNGTPIIAVGCPNGLVGSMDFGWITYKNGVAYITDHRLDLFHTNLSITENGEGFILNMAGDVIGIITHDFYEDNDANINTFIGISKIKRLIKKLANNEHRLYFGIIAEDMPSKALKKAGVKSGIYVNEVEANSPAYIGGIQSGDIIMSINELAVGSMNSFMNAMEHFTVRDKVKVKVMRTTKDGSKELEMSVILGTK